MKMEQSNPPALVRLSEGLGPLPTPHLRAEALAVMNAGWEHGGHVYSKDQMRDYARACMCPLLAEIAALREQLARFKPLRAKGVVDADDNLDCWDTEPFEICTRHVAALNEKDPAAMWRVVDLFARDQGPNVRAERPQTAAPQPE
jgi:hypothetical protein